MLPVSLLVHNGLFLGSFRVHTNFSAVNFNIISSEGPSNLLTYLLTYSMEQSPSWEANRFSASQDIPRILWNPKVHYCIHLSLSSASSTQSIPPHPTSWRSILVLFSHLLLCLPSGFFPQVSPPKPCIHLSSFHTRYMPLPSYSLFYHPHNIGWAVQIIQLLIMQFPLLPCYLVPLRPSTLFSNTLCLPSSLNVSDQILHPWKQQAEL